MNIHQLSVTYVAEQDRILARVNTTAGEELRLWFTRRLLCQLWPLLDRAVTEQIAGQAGAAHLPTADEYTRRMVTEFERANLLQAADFETPFSPQSAGLPLGAEPLLITDVGIKSLPEGKLRLHLSENLGGGPEKGVAPRSFNMLLNAQLSHGLTHLLRKAIATAQWPMGQADGRGAVAAEGIDERAVASGPKYLN